jgi:beta-lactamase class A
MLNKRFSLISLVLISAVSSLLSVFVFAEKSKHKRVVENQPKVIEVHSTNSCEVESKRLVRYKFIKPLLYSNKTCESTNYNKLKSSIIEIIEQNKRMGNIDKSSVYLKILNSRDFITINEEDQFHPASLIKLPLLMTYLQMEERNPGTLNKKIVFHPLQGLPNQTYKSKKIEPEKSYTIKELLKYMIAYSDNNATYLLNENVDENAFKKMFSDFGLIVPDIHDVNYQISAKNYSVFLNVIYNGGYITIRNAEYACELLNECDFNEGMQSGLPGNINIIHQFGEWGDRNNRSIHQLSESGIIYLDNSPYLLTIMTQGKEVAKLPSVLSNVSKTVYDFLKSDNNN